MSQSGSNSQGSVSPDIEFLQGDTGGPVPPNPATFTTILTSSDGSINVDGTPGIYTVDFTTTIQQEIGTGTTTGTGTADIITFVLSATAATVYRFNFLVTGIEASEPAIASTGDGVGYTIDASVKTDKTSATVIATPFTDSDEDTSLLGAVMNVIGSGNSIILRATGVVGTTISFKAIATYVSI